MSIDNFLNQLLANHQAVGISSKNSVEVIRIRYANGRLTLRDLVNQLETLNAEVFNKFAQNIGEVPNEIIQLSSNPVNALKAYIGYPGEITIKSYDPSDDSGGSNAPTLLAAINQIDKELAEITSLDTESNTFAGAINEIYDLVAGRTASDDGSISTLAAMTKSTDTAPHSGLNGPSDGDTPASILQAVEILDNRITAKVNIGNGNQAVNAAIGSTNIDLVTDNTDDNDGTITGAIGGAYLTTTAKTLSEAINELDGELGQLSALNTVDKSSAVAAINEVVSVISVQSGDVSIGTFYPCENGETIHDSAKTITITAGNLEDPGIMFTKFGQCFAWASSGFNGKEIGYATSNGGECIYINAGDGLTKCLGTIFSTINYTTGGEIDG